MVGVQEVWENNEFLRTGQEGKVDLCKTKKDM